MNNPLSPYKVSQNIQLKNDNVDVWCVSLEVDKSCLSSLQQSLSEDERMKAGRMRFKNKRDDYVAARGLLRLIIAAYLKEKPERLGFQYGPHGKPELAKEFIGTGLTFNMSHSHGLAVYGVGHKRVLGVDIEKIRSDMSFTKIAKRFFSPLEFETLQKLPAEQQKQGFFTCWTRKEAYIKAIGQGLFFPLNRFDVSLVPGEPAALLADRKDPRQVSRWTIVNLDVDPNYAAALVVEGKEITVSVKEPWWVTGQVK